jgi:hypothetical protein
LHTTQRKQEVFLIVHDVCANDSFVVLLLCCGIAIDIDPSTYKLTSNHLKIKTVNPKRCGPITLCCCYEYSINNVDLTKVDDVDIIGVPAPFLPRILCCAPGKDLVEVMSRAEKGGKVVLELKQGEGDKVSTLILGQVEECQQIERD